MLHDPVGRHFKHRIRHGEERQRDGVVHRRHPRPLQQIISRLLVEHLCITDIAAVEEVQEVKPAAERQDSDIYASVQPAVALVVV